MSRQQFMNFVDEIFMMDSMTDSSPHEFQNLSLQDADNTIQALKLYRNTLVPIARLPTEILSIIFYLLSGPSFWALKRTSRHTPITPFFLSHVCHRWREISLNLPCLWSHIILTELLPAGASQMIALAKMAPLNLEAAVKTWDLEIVTGQIEAHIHHTRHLSLSASPQDFERMLGRLISSAPSLERLSIKCSNLTDGPMLVPDNLFNGIAPKLSCLHLDMCSISWVSPLLWGLRELELFTFPRGGRTSLNVWFDALSQMHQLERLSLLNNIPIHDSSTRTPMVPGLAVVLPSLRELDVIASVLDCFVVLAHLILPALTRLCINAKNTYDSVTPQLISCVARNAYGPQDTEALQSLYIGILGDGAAAVAWTVPWQDDTYDGSRFSDDLPDGIRLARVAFGIRDIWLRSRMAETHHELLAALPLNHIVSLTVKDRALHRMPVWRDNASRWNKLQRVRLFPSAVPSFQKMLKDAPRGDPLLPSLEELVLIDVSLTEQKVYYLYNMLSKLVELENRLMTLDLRTCIAHDWAVQFLSGIVVNVLGPTRRELGYSLGGRPEWNGVLKEERGGDHGSDEISVPLGSWDTEDEDDSD